MVQLGQSTGDLLDRLGVSRALWTDASMPAVTPLTGEQLGMVQIVDAAAIDERLDRASAAFRSWRHVPAPRRGELVRLWGEELRAAKDDLARLVTIEAGKI
jgi:aldehyde dehydrogenase (NAD+)